MWKPLRSKKLYAILSLMLCGLVLVSCAKKRQQQESASTGSSNNNTTTPGPESTEATAELPCSGQAPVSDVRINFYDNHLSQSTIGRTNVASWTRDAYICGHLEGEDASRKPELALVVGNMGNLEDYDDRINDLASRWIAAAAGSHRRGCVYVASPENLEKLSLKTDLEKIVFFGRGSQGGLMEGLSYDPILVNNIPTFNSRLLRRASFISAQTINSRAQFERIFQRSGAAVDMSNANKTIDQGADEVHSIIDNIWSCEI